MRQALRAHLRNYHTRSLCHYRLLCDDSPILVIQTRYLPNESQEHGTAAPMPCRNIHPRSRSVIVTCYKADRSGDSILIRRGASLRTIAATCTRRESRPSERSWDGVSPTRCSLSQRYGVRTWESARDKGASAVHRNILWHANQMPYERRTSLNLSSKRPTEQVLRVLARVYFRRSNYRLHTVTSRRRSQKQSNLSSEFIIVKLRFVIRWLKRNYYASFPWRVRKHRKRRIHLWK